MAEAPPPVQSPLTVEHLQSLPPDKNPVTIALNKTATVHFARFAFLDNDQTRGDHLLRW